MLTGFVASGSRNMGTQAVQAAQLEPARRRREEEQLITGGIFKSNAEGGHSSLCEAVDTHFSEFLARIIDAMNKDELDRASDHRVYRIDSGLSQLAVYRLDKLYFCKSSRTLQGFLFKGASGILHGRFKGFSLRSLQGRLTKFNLPNRI